ncbi:MAG: hypothetical protein KDF58_13725 [Alphaproteobacteria bacterium]|mgnify:CR=1 FL=1|nr:hypothetical protein [Alphaproteobacteria bacterium]HPF47977.1 hypothetical protein [Emcibacteraceae bacterium]HRW28964.1 hypothetical protein [Emcibacteraceae bacterium]
MIWNKEENRFSWSFIILVVYSTLFLVVFDLIWRLVNIGFMELAAGGAVLWLIGAAAIIFKSRKNIYKKI